MQVFPQHGPGRKHSRPIILIPWQQEIVRLHAGDFVRGCIDSDGCRHRRIVKGRNYPAYSFKNHSGDILRLFAWACRLIGIGSRRVSQVSISVAKRADVAKLDGLMGVDASLQI